MLLARHCQASYPVWGQILLQFIADVLVFKENGYTTMLSFGDSFLQFFKGKQLL